MEKKQLFFGMSKSLPLGEALDFKRSLGDDTGYYLLKVSENPKDRHIDRRARYVVVRHLEKEEKVCKAHAVVANREGFVLI
jgi:hypothetical protein